jgi:hypothetical protein
VHLPAAHERLAGVELPLEEGVHDLADGHDLVARRRVEEVVADAVAVVLRPVRREAHDHRLGADRQRRGEDVEALDALLQVHQPLPGLVVGPLQVVLVPMRLTPTQAPPSYGFIHSG